MDQSQFENEFLRSLWSGLTTLQLCHGYRVTGVSLERDDASSLVRIRLGRGELVEVIRLVRVIWYDGQDYSPDLLSATLTAAVEEWTCARDTPRERDIELGETTI